VCPETWPPRPHQPDERATVTVYSAAATRPLPDLLAVVDEHPVALNGVCIGCGTHGCANRYGALHALAIGHHLPRRRPGATRPELVGAHRIILTG
jgi:hypothetical protein